MKTVKTLIAIGGGILGVVLFYEALFYIWVIANLNQDHDVMDDELALFQGRLVLSFMAIGFVLILCGFFIWVGYKSGKEDSCGH